MSNYLTSRGDIVRARSAERAAEVAYGDGSVAIPNPHHDRLWEVVDSTLTHFRGDLWLEVEGA